MTGCVSSARHGWVGLWEVDKAGGGLISVKDRHQACQANPPTGQLNFINIIINPKQVVRGDSYVKKGKKNNVSILFGGAAWSRRAPADVF